jgi:hypothetical protein
MIEEIKNIIVLSLAGFFIGIMLGILGLTIKNFILWWYIELPLLIILTLIHKKIWNFLLIYINLFSKNKKYI